MAATGVGLAAALSRLSASLRPYSGLAALTAAAAEHRVGRVARSEASVIVAASADSTVIIVAQRVSTVLDADQIIVLEDGRIIYAGEPCGYVVQMENGFKMEVESLITKDISYVTEEYVPTRLKKKDWLD